MQGLTIASLVLSFTCAALISGWSQDGDKFDGAVWTFVMTPKRPGAGLKTLKGVFSVKDHVIYQRTNPMGEFDKRIGKNNPKGQRTAIDLTDFRAFDEDKKWHMGLSGKARLSIDRLGEWSGLFTDGEGRNWDFKCSRVQE